MPRNPFNALIEDEFRCERVRVETAAHTYVGWLRAWHYNHPAVVLFDAVRDPEAVEIDEKFRHSPEDATVSEREDESGGARVGTTMIHQPESVERLESPSRIEQVALDVIVGSPYSQRSFQESDFAEFVRTLRQRGHHGSFPVVRPTSGAPFEIVSGHRRVEAARRAGFDTLPVRVVELSDWEATVRFIDEHIPLPADESDVLAGEQDGTDDEGPDDEQRPHQGFYTQSEIEGAIAALRDRWSDEHLRELPALRPHLAARDA